MITFKFWFKLQVQVPVWSDPLLYDPPDPESTRKTTLNLKLTKIYTRVEAGINSKFCKLTVNIPLSFLIIMWHSTYFMQLDSQINIHNWMGGTDYLQHQYILGSLIPKLIRKFSGSQQLCYSLLMPCYSRRNHDEKPNRHLALPTTTTKVIQVRFCFKVKNVLC